MGIGNRHRVDFRQIIDNPGRDGSGFGGKSLTQIRQRAAGDLQRQFGCVSAVRFTGCLDILDDNDKDNVDLRQ